MNKYDQNDRSRSLYKLPPDEFARITLSGQDDTKKLEIVCYLIRQACEKFVNHESAKQLHSFLNGPGIPFNAESINQCEAYLTNHVQNLRRLSIQQYGMLQKILAMKHLVSRELGIPPRRLCDYIFQYSPLIHDNRLRKYIENWEEILNYHQYLPDGDQEDEAITDRLKGLQLQNIRIYEQFKRRMGYQAQFLNYRDLHSVIRSFISENSTSSSLLKYAWGLSQVAAEYRLVMGVLPDKNSPEYQSCCAKLCFLSYKQRAHPGFDLNVHLVNLCSIMANSSNSPDWGLMESVLRKLPKQSSNQNPLSVAPLQIKSEIEALSMLSAMVRKVIVDNRNDIIRQFTRYCRSYFGSHAFRDSYILTHGHSKTVREVLKRGLQPLAPNVPNVFVLESDDEDDFETRLMLYELREDEEFSFLRNAASTKIEFVKLLGSQAKVMVVLGAECFDSDLRVLHPLGISNSLKSLKQSLGSHFQVIVVAEEYKCYTDLMFIPEFYRNHLDRVKILDSSLVDGIITNEKIYHNLSTDQPSCGCS
jgi:translation initiation factor 2B subunit (eIF-2B alpha/beta/delta family)